MFASPTPIQRKIFCARSTASANSWRAARRLSFHPFCVSRKPTRTTASPASCEMLGTSPSARKPIASVNGETSDGNNDRARGAEQNHRAGEKIDGRRAGESALDDGLQQIFEKSRGQHIVEAEQQHRQSGQRQHARDDRCPHRRDCPHPHQNAEDGEEASRPRRTEDRRQYRARRSSAALRRR